MAEKLDGEPAADPGAAERGDGDEPTDLPATTAAMDLPFPGYVATAFYRLHQTSLPRRWCLAMITWPYLLQRFHFPTIAEGRGDALPSLSGDLAATLAKMREI